jgi:hypothetical protein
MGFVTIAGIGITDNLQWRVAHFSEPQSLIGCPISRVLCEKWGLSCALEIFLTHQQALAGRDTTRHPIANRFEKPSLSAVLRGLVEQPDQWKWSSFRSYYCGERGVVRINFQEGPLEIKALRARRRAAASHLTSRAGVRQ